MQKKLEVIVDMSSKFDASLLQISLLGMMVKVVSVNELRVVNPKKKSIDTKAATS